MMTRNPALHSAPLGYGKDGPLTWIAECRVPWESPSPARLAMAEWMIAHGSDMHQGGDGPLMRAALNAYRIPMMELLASRGADVNALWHGHFPIIFAPASRWIRPLLNGFSITAQIRTVATMGTRQTAIHIAARLSTTSLRGVRAFCGTTKRLHRHPSRGRWRDQVRRAGCAETAPRAAGPADLAVIRSIQKPCPI